eukprot:CAMPEP_0185458810 /NCGR_PEP_ID=MMETSP1365-20130426/83332_1 /TAXON_ID=38817 /ORGANISM="Gephyrocapsa oceanica, Strain RCC1303" /LENGTH=83 /DNA_ID=CAMNT_0028065323 /DNA_START=188 /DNA_END=435 /DNA_ORIENTATION=-
MAQASRQRRGAPFRAATPSRAADATASPPSAPNRERCCSDSVSPPGGELEGELEPSPSSPLALCSGDPPSPSLSVATLDAERR